MKYTIQIHPAGYHPLMETPNPSDGSPAKRLKVRGTRKDGCTWRRVLLLVRPVLLGNRPFCWGNMWVENLWDREYEGMYVYVYLFVDLGSCLFGSWRPKDLKANLFQGGPPKTLGSSWRSTQT